MGSHLIQENFEKINEKNREDVIEKTKIEVFELLKKTIRPEFLNRIDETIMFSPLTKTDVRQIVKLQLKNVFKALKENNIWLNTTEEAIDWLTRVGYDPQFGARPVKRLIQKSVLNELSKQILANKVDKETDLVLDVFEDKFVFRKPILSDHLMN